MEMSTLPMLSSGVRQFTFIELLRTSAGDQKSATQIAAIGHQLILRVLRKLLMQTRH